MATNRHSIPLKKPAIDETGQVATRRNENHTACWRTANGDLHREDGPAVLSPNGDRRWFKNSRWHRLDGPAVEWADGKKGWYLWGFASIETEVAYAMTLNEAALTIAEGLADEWDGSITELLNTAKTLGDTT